MRRRLLLSLIFIMVVAFGGLALVRVTGSGPELGLDLQGGVSVVLQPVTKADDGQLDVALEVIRNRVDALGVAEPEIVRQGGAIVVQLPGVENKDRAIQLVGQTAELRFRPVLNQIPSDQVDAARDAATSTTTAPGETSTTAPGATTTTTAASSDTTEGALGVLGATPPGSGGGLVEGESAAVVQEDPTTTAPPATTTPPTTAATGEPSQQPSDPFTVTTSDDDKADATVTLEDKAGENLYQLGPSLATGKIVQSAQAELSPSGTWLVSLTMRGGSEGIDLFNQVAAQCNPPSQVCPTGRLAIVLDSVVQSAPTISESSYQRDQIQISGDFNQSDAKDLGLVLRYGSLPVELERQNVETVSASLGEDSLRAGIIAGIVGVSLVALYMVLYYRALGLVVIAGMTVWASLLYSIVSWLGSAQGLALTLAGVTGIIVSVGVTVDSYVVFFERLKDEVKAGRTLRTSTDRAFKRAFRTILTADVSSFLGAAVLWWLTVGSVRGFAFFLGLSTVLDVVVTWFFTRPLVTILSRNPTFTEAPILGVARGLAAPASAAAPTPAVAGREARA
ncbi:MAG TPA: protein translocase subunit SecD [Acidimicrobiales bacterium]|nr:protein translocase subunit SecD [Acidimicrobiales bacterium]